MLQIKNIHKEYRTGDLVQKALDDVSLTLRDNEFVAILGPSGSGKTTLLNIIGGLDRYDSGDLIINGISTQKYKDRDWDSYRNHTIGFVFQSYNLIPHQTVLANVELALTISGISKKERRQRAKEALEKVGLGPHINKKPNQMSGGQMQRVAIARALVNDPDILLADEPTGALDTDTSVQVMDLLAEVAKDRLVVMVTHNPELAEQYANRIVRVRDGKILEDSNPYDVKEETPAEHKNMGKASMSWLTALALSFNNLKTKKARTLLTAFAGSIGIIGIALILSLSNGVNNYIEKIQRDTMTSYPIQIDATTIDLSSMVQTTEEKLDPNAERHELDGVYSNTMDLEMVSTVITSISQNNLTAFKKYLENPDSKIHDYIGSNGIVYSYNTRFTVLAKDPENKVVNTDGSTFMPAGMSSMMSSSSMSSMMVQMNNFEELLPGRDEDTLISPAIKENYELLYGEWPNEYNEVVLVLNSRNEIASTVLYQLGLLPSSEYIEYMTQISEGEKIEPKSTKWTYEDICNHKFYLIPACDTYINNGDGTFTSIANYPTEMAKLMDDAVELKISGVIRLDEEADVMYISEAVGYTRELTNYIIDYTKESEVVKAQMADEKINVLTGFEFGYIPEMTLPDMGTDGTTIPGMDGTTIPGMDGTTIPGMDGTTIPGMDGTTIPGTDGTTVPGMDGTTIPGMDGTTGGLDSSIMDMYTSEYMTATYDNNMVAFGYIDYDAPSSISIYADTFEDKDFISDCITQYNEGVSEEDKIVYTDYIGLLLSSVTTIIDVISYVLIAFVSVSLIVSSIMIGIITYISVLERTKEIGILRAMGASKKNISQVFNAETFIVGLCSGLLGIGISVLVLIPGNAIIHAVADTNDVNAVLPLGNAIFLVVLSVVLTLIGGLIPSKKAAKKDPVTALRTE